MKLHLYFGLAAVALASCGPQHERQQAARNASERAVPAPTAPPTAVRTESAPAPSTAKAPEPAIDPKGTEAAVQLVQQFAGLLNERKFDEAYMLLEPNAPPRAEFDRSWGQFDTFTVRLGTPGQQEGAAGSIYLSVPLDVSAVGHGKSIHLSPIVILRRVNDVPGSTEAQRHWHIERIDRGGSH